MIYHVIWWTVQSTINWKIKSDIIKKIYSQDDESLRISIMPLRS